MELSAKLRLNASIERLIESGGKDAEARTAVAEFGRELAPASRFEIEASITKPGGTIAGETDGLGTISVKDETNATTELSHGSPKERIGHYVIQRERSRHEDRLVISHFWKADIGTESETEPPQQWVLALDRDGRPQWFGERGFRVLWTFRITKALLLEVSREIYPQSWGVAEVAEHKGAVAVKVVVTTE